MYIYIAVYMLNTILYFFTFSIYRIIWLYFRKFKIIVQIYIYQDIFCHFYIIFFTFIGIINMIIFRIDKHFIVFFINNDKYIDKWNLYMKCLQVLSVSNFIYSSAIEILFINILNFF